MILVGWRNWLDIENNRRIRYVVFLILIGMFSYVFVRWPIHYLFIAILTAIFYSVWHGPGEKMGLWGMTVGISLCVAPVFVFWFV